jgi:hypothetical protein
VIKGTKGSRGCWIFRFTHKQQQQQQQPTTNNQQPTTASNQARNQQNNTIINRIAINNEGAREKWGKL